MSSPWPTASAPQLNQQHSPSRPRFTFIGLFILAGMATAIPASALPKTRVLFDVGMRGELLGSDLNSRLQFDNKGEVKGMRTSLSGGRVRSDFGDVNASWDDLSFASRGFYGVKLGIPTGKLTTTLMGGTVAIQDLDGSSKTSPIYGLRTAWSLNSKLTLNASHLLAPAASDEQGHLINALSLAYSPRLNTRLGMEIARSSGGTAWQISALHSDKKLTAKALVRSAGLGFSSAGNPDLIRERSGYEAQLRYKVGSFSLGGATQRYRDGLGGREFADSASLDFARRGLPSVSLFWQSSEQLTQPFSLLDLEGVGPLAASAAEADDRRLRQLQPTQSNRVGVQLSHTLASTNLTLGFERNQSLLTNTPLSAQSSDRISMAISRPIGQRTSARLYHSWNVSSAAQPNANQTGQVTQLNVNHRFSNGIGLSVGLQRQEYRSALVSGNALITDLGIVLPLGKSSSIGLQYRTALRGSGAFTANTDRVQIRVSRNFDVGKKRKSNARTASQRRLLGRIAGRVFDDRNNNGRFDAGEVAIPNVAVSIRSGIQKRSDREGNYHFDELRPLKYKVALINKTLPIEFAVLAATEVSVLATSGKTTTVDFPAVRTGQIQGLVFEDSNRNGQHDTDEKVLPGAMVQVENSEVISFSNERGEFNLSNLPAQTWNISVDTSCMDGDYEMTATAPPAIKVAPNGTVTDVLLGVAIQNRSTVTTFQKFE